jgi:hypothetical protein
MQNIGFVEKSDNEKASMIKFLVDSAKGINTSKINKEVNPMTEETAVVEETTEVTKSEEVAPEVDAKADTVEEATEEATEKAAKPASGAADSEEDSEDEEDAEDMEKKKPEVSKSDEAVAESIAEIKNTLTSAFSDLVSTVKSLQAEVEMLKSSKVDVNTVKDSFDAVAKDIAAVSSGFNEFGKRVELVEQDTAFRKSGDLGEIVQNQPETVEKSLWGGSFLKTADLFI